MNSCFSVFDMLCAQISHVHYKDYYCYYHYYYRYYTIILLLSFMLNFTRFSLFLISSALEVTPTLFIKISSPQRETSFLLVVGYLDLILNSFLSFLQKVGYLEVLFSQTIASLFLVFLLVATFPFALSLLSFFKILSVRL